MRETGSRAGTRAAPYRACPFAQSSNCPNSSFFCSGVSGGAAGGLLPLVDEAREYRPEILQVRRGGHLRIPLQPLLGRRKAPPARQFRGDAHFMPFRVVPRIEERLKAGEERFDEIDQIAVALGPLLEVGGDQHGTDRDGVDGLVLRHQARVIRGSEPGRDIARGHRRVEGNGEEVKAVRGVQRSGRSAPVYRQRTPWRRSRPGAASRAPPPGRRLSPRPGCSRARRAEPP